MRLEKVDLNLFVVFDAIYREGSITKVSIALNLTQPGVSNALSRLRKTFDDPLFVRTSLGMQPTPVADNLIIDVRRALALLGRSIDVNTRFDPAISERTFRIGMNDLAASFILPELQQRISADARHVAVACCYHDRSAATEDLRTGAIDLLIDSPEVNAKEFDHLILGRLEYVVASKKNHALAGKPLPLSDYLAGKHLHVSSRRSGRGQVDIALHAIGQRRNVSMRVQHYWLAARIIETTDLLWTLPELLANGLSVEAYRLPFAVEPLRWHLYWHKNADRDPANLWIRQLVLEVASEKLHHQ